MGELLFLACALPLVIIGLNILIAFTGATYNWDELYG